MSAMPVKERFPAAVALRAVIEEQITVGSLRSVAVIQLKIRRAGVRGVRVLPNRGEVRHQLGSSSPTSGRDSKTFNYPSGSTDRVISFTNRYDSPYPGAVG